MTKMIMTLCMVFSNPNSLTIPKKWTTWPLALHFGGRFTLGDHHEAWGKVIGGVCCAQGFFRDSMAPLAPLCQGISPFEIWPKIWY